jgi:hypothetical protein
MDRGIYAPLVSFSFLSSLPLSSHNARITRERVKLDQHHRMSGVLLVCLSD